MRSHGAGVAWAKKETERYSTDELPLHVAVHGTENPCTCKNFYSGDKNDHHYYSQGNLVYIKNKVKQFLIIPLDLNVSGPPANILSVSQKRIRACSCNMRASLFNTFRALTDSATFPLLSRKDVVNRAETLHLVQSNIPFMIALRPKHRASLDISRCFITNWELFCCFRVEFKVFGQKSEHGLDRRG